MSLSKPHAEERGNTLDGTALAHVLRAVNRHRLFLGQSNEFPEALRIMPLLCTPVLLVLLLMFYWLVRVLFTQWRPTV